MALNTAPSFGKSAGGSLSNQVAGQRAAKRRAMPMQSGNMGKSAMGGPPMRPNPPMSKSFGGGGGGGVRPPGNGLPASTGMNPHFGGPSMGGPPMGPIANSPGQRFQGPPLMDAGMDGMPPPEMGGGMGGGMVANNAPPMDLGPMMDSMPQDSSGIGDRLRSKMGGNTGITGGMFPRRPGMFSAY